MMFFVCFLFFYVEVAVPEAREDLQKPAAVVRGVDEAKRLPPRPGTIAAEAVDPDPVGNLDHRRVAYRPNAEARCHRSPQGPKLRSQHSTKNLKYKRLPNPRPPQKNKFILIFSIVR